MKRYNQLANVKRSQNHLNEQLDMPEENAIMPKETVKSMLVEMAEKLQTQQCLLLDQNRRLRKLECTISDIQK